MDVHVYTRARRLAVQVGRIGDIPIPTAAWWQFAAAALAVIAILATSGVGVTPAIWPHWPVPLRAVAVLGSPVAAFWASGRIQPDGLNPFTALVGLAAHCAGACGWGSGRRDRTPVRLHVRIPVVEIGDQP